jgi:hypothetical protein
VFDVPRHGRILSCNATSKMADNFNIHGSVVNKFFFFLALHVPFRHHRTMNDRSNAAESTPSARQKAVTLQMSSKSLQRILHEDFKFHPYKSHTTHTMKE